MIYFVKGNPPSDEFILAAYKIYCEDLNLPYSPQKILRDGKPRFEDGVKFNLTHSGEYTVVAFSESEVGIDLEKKEKRNLERLKAYLDIDGDDDLFYDEWTRREAELKKEGKGIESIRNFKPQFAKNVFFAKGYSFAVCGDYGQIKEILWKRKKYLKK